MIKLNTVGWMLSAAILVAACVALAYLVLPGSPTSTANLHFDGFIILPPQSGAWPVSVMDYLTVYRRNLFVASIRPGAVFRVPLEGGALPGAADIGVLPGKPAAHGVAFDPASGLGFVSRSGDQSVDVFNPTTMRLVRTIPVGGDLDGIVFDPFAKLVYVASGDDRRATLIEPAQQQTAGSIALPGKPEYAVVDTVAHLIYQNLVDTDEVAAIDLEKREIVGRWPLPGCKAPTGMVLDISGPRLYIACRGNAAMVVFDLGQHLVTASAAIGLWTDTIAYDSERRLIYTIGFLGQLVALRQNENATKFNSETIWLHVGAHTLAVDEVTHRLYVAYASLLVPPRLAVFSAPP
jgi:DNA-binding beta-propeller fold protein YncE